ncbi:MAG: RNA-binding protein [Euryarchaeota archaeon]|nr:RNA-binding protein [Euryarchaeota archaeon]|tara:strand:- start:83 stop:250 length:168 start_codon:yes stop_codon:yes gene_type:complete
MAERAEVCNSSGVPLVESNSTSFPCPECGTPIGRSPICRNQGVTYICPTCGFTGP